MGNLRELQRIMGNFPGTMGPLEELCLRIMGNLGELQRIMGNSWTGLWISVTDKCDSHIYPLIDSHRLT